MMVLMMLFFAAGAGLAFWTLEGRSIRKSYEPDRLSVGNPLMGYAPRADQDTLSEDVQLVYVDITWRELEPEKGQYAFDEIIEDNRLERWRAEGKHVVLRFVCDFPEEESDLDIPDWLYEEIGKAGTWYDIEYGKGFAPDYNNGLFIEYHAQAVKALGERFGQDTFVSYIELGSLGHWGEWHVDYDSGIQRMPKAEVRERYITPWIAAFPNAQILMRRPFAAAEKYGLGLYNDMAGHLDSTQEWLDWIEEGGNYSQAEEKNALVAMADFWKHAPSGGELTSSATMEQMLAEDGDQTVELVRRSHTTFLGPKIADDAYEDGYDALLRSMGYRLYVREAALIPMINSTRLEMTWSNLGVAPMYWDWPVMVYVWDAQGNVVESVEADLQLSTVLPETEIVCSVELLTKGLTQRATDYYVGVGIVDPMTGRNAVRLDMQAVRLDNATILFK